MSDALPLGSTAGRCWHDDFNNDALNSKVVTTNRPNLTILKSLSKKFKDGRFN
jgi:hypothetical protein